MLVNALALTSTYLSIVKNKITVLLARVFASNYAATASIDLHSAAHLLQASAHSMQWCMSVCFSHSVAQAIQAASHFLQSASKFVALFLLAVINSLQASLQAIQSFTEFSIPAFPLFSVEQVSQVSTHF